MNLTGAGPIQPFVTVSPYSPLGKPAVGQESPDTKDKPLPPVEETEASTRSAQHRIGEDAEGGGQGQQHRPGEETAEEEAAPEAEPVPAVLALAELEVNTLAAQLAMRARIDQAGHPEPQLPTTRPRLPAGGFGTDEPAAAGALLDQKI